MRQTHVQRRQRTGVQVSSGSSASSSAACASSVSASAAAAAFVFCFCSCFLPSSLDLLLPCSLALFLFHLLLPFLFFVLFFLSCFLSPLLFSSSSLTSQIITQMPRESRIFKVQVPCFQACHQSRCIVIPRRVMTTMRISPENEKSKKKMRNKKTMKSVREIFVTKNKMKKHKSMNM